MAKVEVIESGTRLQDGMTAEEWLHGCFVHEWCPECGRDHRHHTVMIDPLGLFHATCDREPVYDRAGYEGRGHLVINPECYQD